MKVQYVKENIVNKRFCNFESESLRQRPLHTAGSDTIFVQIYMDAPPGVPGVSKEPEGHEN